MILRITIRLLALLPFRVRSRLGEVFGYLFGALPLRDQKIAREQLASFLKPKNPDALVRSVFAHFGSVAMEAIRLDPALSTTSPMITCENLALVEHYARDKQPTVALTAHLGNWELLAAYMCSLNIPVVTVAREARSAPLQALLRHERARFGVETIWRGGVAAQRALVETLQAKKTLAALIDQDTRVSGKSSQFFGSYVQTPSALIELGKRHNARFVSAFCYRSERYSYKVRVEEISSNLNVEEIIHAYNLGLERIIREYPEQWVWFHKRWRTKPDGERLSSSEYWEFLKNVNG